ncbi:GcrA family cell cycle regulator [Parafrankia sp. EUN1f]|uniref:GcrA family cell cycle regulator n=1 Tax=Parafrankia sp. EUN1f TaxID=102897 RepID=UPI0001C46D0D|nr:GcrA family cell cycle regulator [Parafrankia sp. EUN1f]EFC80188.1 hypothetical protein FrEUN1fDRAFT_6717 [Parafrankia sp. EUN1f]
MASRATPFTDADVERLRELHTAGMSCGAIARQMGRSRSTVSEHAKRLGLAFDGPPAEATAVKAATNREMRADLIRRMLRRAGAVLDRLEADTYQHRITTGEASYIVSDPVVPAADEKALSGAIASYMRTAMEAEKLDAAVGDTDGRSMLEALADGLKAVARAQNPVVGPDDEPDG